MPVERAGTGDPPVCETGQRGAVPAWTDLSTLGQSIAARLWAADQLLARSLTFARFVANLLLFVKIDWFDLL